MQKVVQSLNNLGLIAEMLPPEFLEKGEARKFKIAGLTGDFDVEILQVEPHTKIAEHQHDTNWEVQVCLTTGEILGVCFVGGSHELVNDTDKPWEVLCLKGNNGATLFY